MNAETSDWSSDVCSSDLPKTPKPLNLKHISKLKLITSNYLP